MYKISFLYLLISLLLLPYARAQDEEPYPYVPIPTDTAYKWNVMMGKLNLYNQGGIMFPGTWVTGKTITYSFKPGTTVINGKEYYTMEPDNPDAFGTFGAKFVRQDSVERKVYWCLSGETSETLLYDFTKNAGDTIDLRRFTDIYKDKLVVDSIKYMELDNKIRKILYLKVIEPAYAFNKQFEAWIEGIGSIWGPITPMLLLLEHQEHELQCLTFKGIPVFKNPRFENCVDTIGVLNPIDKLKIVKPKLVTYPNPVSDILNLKLNLEEPLQISIYNLAGTRLLLFEVSENNSELNLNSLPTGIYNIAVQSTISNQFFTQKIIKQ